MDAVTHYKAPWSKGLILMSAVATLLCPGIAFGTPLLPAPKHGNWLAMRLRWLPLAFVPACALFTGRGAPLCEAYGGALTVPARGF